MSPYAGPNGRTATYIIIYQESQICTISYCARFARWIIGWAIMIFKTEIGFGLCKLINSWQSHSKFVYFSIVRMRYTRTRCIPHIRIYTRRKYLLFNKNLHRKHRKFASHCAMRSLINYSLPPLTIIIYFPYSTCISSFFGSNILTSLFVFKMFFHSCFCYFCTIYSKCVTQRTFEIVQKNRDHANIMIKLYP